MWQRNRGVIMFYCHKCKKDVEGLVCLGGDIENQMIIVNIQINCKLCNCSLYTHEIIEPLKY